MLHAFTSTLKTPAEVDSSGLIITAEQ